ncbi:hypothetical protein OA801_20860 [Citrobacter portucalensis]|nr:hypothetical protein [Citrobacter portucalensis]MDN4360183.1 hypothetical protein [Citrobacter portucalensis]MDN4365673.1 hypothetical protein [Citrobacter portucalensis]MDN4376369.1 hypothetical protein [Citrobacter portucalensis]MDN4381261.1 hypothetical protein [Citrobacter portucalensis]MDN4391322.1 hypothetical protein [Citrobacter portucalensis]
MSKDEYIAKLSGFEFTPEWCIRKNKDIEFINDVSATSLIRKIYGAYLPGDSESRRDGSKERSVMQYVSMRNVFERLDCIFSEALQHGVASDDARANYNKERFHANRQAQLINHLMLYSFCYQKLNDFHRYYIDYIKSLVDKARNREFSLVDSGEVIVKSFFPSEKEPVLEGICSNGWNAMPIKWQASSDRIYKIFDKGFNEVVSDYCQDGVSSQFLDYVRGSIRLIDENVSKLTELYYQGMSESDAGYNYYEKKTSFDTIFLFSIVRYVLAKENKRVLSMPSFFIKARYVINVPKVRKKMKMLRDFILIDICYQDLQSADNEVTWEELYDHLLNLLTKYHNQRSRPAETSFTALEDFYDRSMQDNSIIKCLERNLCPLDRMEDQIKRFFK